MKLDDDDFRAERGTRAWRRLAPPAGEGFMERGHLLWHMHWDHEPARGHPGRFGRRVTPGGEGRTTNALGLRGPKAGETPARHGFRFMSRPDLQSLDAQWDHEPIGAPTWSRLKAFATFKAGYKPALRALRFMGSLHIQRFEGALGP